MPKTPEHLRRVRALFDLAMEQPMAERAAWLARADGWSEAERDEVGRLIAAGEATGSFVDDPAGRAFAVPAAAGLAPGDKLGPYEVARLVGLGGMGAVYEAVRADDQYKKRVAIKLVRRGLDSDLTLARFRRERQILASLEHRNIATLLDGGVSPDGFPFLVMEYVEGEPITAWCASHHLAARERVALFRQVCAAVQHAHKNLIVHRDLKPGNILVAADGTVKLLDFGIAKLLGDEASADGTPLTRGDTRAFTPEYASPEQLRGDTLTTASDVYSLGVVLYELLTGNRPGPDGRGGALSGDMDAITQMALRREPEQRYGSVEAMGDDLQRYLSGRPVLARRGWIGYRLRKFVQRNAAAVVVSGLLLIALAGGVLAVTRESRRLRVERTKAVTVSGFLQQLLSSVQPATGGRDVPVSEVLAQAAVQMDSGLKDQPGVRADLEGVLGQSYLSLGRFEDAEPHFRRELALAEQVGGATSDATVRGLLHLGQLFSKKGEIDRADSFLVAGIERKRRLSGKPDTLLVDMLSSRASLEHDRGRLQSSEALHREVLALRRQLEGEQSDNVASSLNNVAVSVGEQNRWAEADTLHRLAVAILKHNHPDPTPAVADAMSQLASALDFEGKSEAADSAYREVLALRKKLLGEQHVDYNFTLLSYSTYLMEHNRFAEAVDRAGQILSHRGSSLPDSHPIVAAGLLIYGKSLDGLGRFDEGGKAIAECVAIRRKIYPPTHWLVGNSERHLGIHYTAAHRYADAEKVLLHGYGLVLAALGPDHPRTQDAVRAIADLYRAWGRPSQEAEYRAKLPKG